MHYALALPGLRNAFLPARRELSARPWYPTIIQSVLEYRGYVLVIPFVAALAHLAHPVPRLVLWPLFGFWLVRSVHRLRTFRSPLAFWRGLWRESRHPRSAHALSAQLVLEMERRARKGLGTRDLEAELFVIQESVLTRGNK